MGDGVCGLHEDGMMEQDVMYEVWQDDELQAASNSMDEAIRYAIQYGQDGPVRLVCAVTIRKDITISVNGIPVWTK